MYAVGLFIAVLIGIVLGLVGGGGSILTVPLLNTFFSTTMLLATTYSLIVVTVSSLFGFSQRIKSNEVDFKTGIQFAVPSMIVAFSIRYWVMPLFPIQFDYGNIIVSRDVIITSLLIVVMLFTAARMVQGNRSHSNKSSNRFISIVIFGVMTGLLSGFIGAGGGFIIVPILIRMGLDLRKAVGTSMLIITIQSIVALVGDFFNPEIRAAGIDWKLVIIISLLTIVGVYIGTLLQKRISSLWLKRIFAAILFAVAIGMLIKMIIN